LLFGWIKASPPKGFYFDMLNQAMTIMITFMLAVTGRVDST